MDSNNNITRSPKLVDLYQRFRRSKFQDASESNHSNRAAVLICLFEEEHDIHVILTKRSSKLSSHSGEVALPGGRTDKADRDDVETALREAKEEIGLDPALVDIVTVLEPFVTKGNITIVPVIGILWDKQSFNPVPNAEEVESIFTAPLEMFLKNENRSQQEKEFQGDKYVLHYFRHETKINEVYVIWAVTAGILITAASLVYQRQPDFQTRMPKFWNKNYSRS